MIAIATSSWKQFRPEMGLPVRTTLGRPRFRLGYEYEEIRLLAPTPKEFKLTGEEFDRAYTARLNGIGAEKLRNIFEEMAERYCAERLVLLCFENVLRGQACHRRTFARWWQEHTGQKVPELDPEDFGLDQRLF